MRRAVVAVIVGGFACGGIGSGLGEQSGIFGASLNADAGPTITRASLTAAVEPVQKANHKTGKARANAKNSAKNNARNSATKKAASKVISYDGLQFSVPVGWPVYWLDQNPDQCVRYDINAVYVGAPGVNQNCPAGLIGRADTISIGGPSTSAVSPTPAKADQRAMIDGNPVTDPSVTPGTIVEDPDLHEFAVAIDRKSVV